MYFWATDLLRFLLAFCLFTAFLVPPGAVLAHYFQIRPATAGDRDKLALAVALSAGCLPVLMFLAGHFLSDAGVWTLLGLFWLVFVFKFRQLAPSLSSRIIFGAFALGFFFYFTLADLPWAEGLFGAVTNLDYVKHAAVTAAVARDGVQPASPFLRPGHDIGMFYYLYWHMVAGWVMRCGGPALNAMSTSIAGAAWALLVFLAVLRMYIGDITGEGEELRTRWRSSLVLLLITGADLIGAGLGLLEGRDVDRRHLEWWNNPQVGSWLSTFLWVPQHVVSLSAGLTGLLVARRAASRPFDRRSLAYCLLAGMCFASAVGASVWVAFAIGSGAACWVAWSVAQRDWREVRVFVLVGCFAIILSVPFLLYLHGVDAAHVNPIGITVRGFSLVEPVTDSMPRLEAAVIRLFTLPINYFLEFGFYAIAAGIYLLEVRRRKRSLQQIEKMGLVVIATSLLLVTFLKSIMGTNDLGIRGSLPAQFFLLLISVLVLEHQPSIRNVLWQKNAVPKALALFAAIGVAGSVYDWTVGRFSALVDYRDAGLVRDDNPHLRYQIRQAYDFVHSRTPVRAVVQQNPSQRWAQLYGMYGDRPVAVSDVFHGSLFSVPQGEYRDTIEQVKKIFQKGESGDAVRDIVQRYSIAALIVRQSDPVWDDATGWTRERNPDFETPLVRVYLFPRTP